MNGWYVAYTQPMKEVLAAQQLENQGFEVYCPRFKKERRHARRVDQVLVPLFPRYLFVKVDPDASPWRSINGTIGISYLLMIDDRTPASLPSSVIAHMKEKEEAGGVVPVETLSHFVGGDEVLILEGVLKDHKALFQSFDDKKRAQVLLDFMGKEMKVSLPTYAIEAV